MITQWLKKLLPKRESIVNLTALQKIKQFTADHKLWVINCRSVSLGVGIGLFSAFIPLPIQMLLAAILSITFRSNLPIAILMTWVSNPFTFIPFNFLIYAAGSFVTGNEISYEINLSVIGARYFIGLAIVSLVSGLIGFLVTWAICKISVNLRVLAKRERKTNHIYEKQNLPWHAVSVSEIIGLAQTNVKGLSEVEVQRRKRIYGQNLIQKQKKKSKIVIFLSQFNYLIVYVLLGASVITSILHHWIDTGVILSVVIVNAFIGFTQEGKAEKAIEAIRNMLSLHTTVIRESRRKIVSSESLVPGDIVLLKSGDKVPADLRLIETKDLQIQESSLTGESFAVEKGIQAVEKTSDLAERKSMAFASTLVVSGRGTGVVVATGQNTEIGKIGILIEKIAFTTPFLEKTKQFSVKLTFIILSAALMTFLFGVYVRGYSTVEMFMAAVGLAVAAVPEGLPAIITIAIAIGVTKMAKQNAIVRRLPIVETLGTVTVICTDKTGTLTLNELSVQNIVTSQHEFSVTGTGYGPLGNFMLMKKIINPNDYPDLIQSIYAGVLCNDAELSKLNEDWHLIGNPMDGALLSLGNKSELDIKEIKFNYPLSDTIPFESEHKYMATLHHDHEGRGYIYVKGACEQILSMCSSQLFNGHPVPLNKEYWLKRMDLLAEQGQRVLAIGLRFTTSKHRFLEFQDVEQNLTFLGLFGLFDPPAEEAIQAIRACQSAGIHVKMITGDYGTTAKTIARQIGIDNCNRVLTGHELDQLSACEFANIVNEVDLFARTSPIHKIKLVEALQSKGQVVAMTGDGVNDAPALKQADVGIAMGKRGTEAAKEVSEIVLTDDNFSSIVAAIKEGRTVHDNLLKTILFILPTDGGEALIIIFAIIVGWVLPITPLQILWVNTITAISLGFALAFEPTEKKVMQRPPPKTHERFFSIIIIWRTLFVSLLLLVGAFGLFWWMLKSNNNIELARTLTVNIFVIGEICYLFNCRNILNSSINFKSLFASRAVFISIFIVISLQLAFCYVPWLQNIFKTVGPNLIEWGYVWIFGITLFLLVEIEKWVMRKFIKSV